MGLWEGIRRALFMRRVRKAQYEWSGVGGPEINRRMRRALRVMLTGPDQTWPVSQLCSKALISQESLYELGKGLSSAGLGEVIWGNGVRVMRLTELGRQEVPRILASYQSQRLVMILLREGPRSAGYAWVARHRDRKWRRALKRGHGAAPPDADASELDIMR
jgi:hypothetical protein